MNAPADAGRNRADRSRAVMLFDGECGFCRLWIERWREATRGRVEFLPYQENLSAFPEVTRERAERAVQLIEPGRPVTEAAAAVFRAWEIGRDRSIAARAYTRRAWFRGATEAVYRFVARHRPGFSQVTRLLYGRDVRRPTYVAADWLFLRLLGVSMVVAFVSFWVQVDGLIGPTGLLPAHDFLRLLGGVIPPANRWWRWPTLCWWWSGPDFLHGLCAAGTVAGVALFVGAVPRWALVVAWMAYASLVGVGQDFLSFQWDVLLLEVAAAALLLAPAGWWTWRSPAAGNRAGRLVLRLVLFKLMFLSGVVKLRSGDETWRDLTALQHHFETQPLPTWIGWWAHQLPGWMLVGACAAMFAIELVLPFFIGAPRRLRLLAFAGLAGLQLVIALTGNYAFFNLLSFALCLLLVDDRSFGRVARWLPCTAARRRGHAPVRNGRSFGSPVAITAAVALAVLSVWRMAVTTTGARHWPAAMLAPLRIAESLHLSHGYGLFAVMTTERPELIIEGSADGRAWREYSFRWKPGDVQRRPGFVEPHQPRLDWQLWFAALGQPAIPRWLGGLLLALAENRPAVLRLLGENPFPDRPPEYLRVLSYDYRFTTRAERRSTGAWWKREARSILVPAVDRDMLRRALDAGETSAMIPSPRESHSSRSAYSRWRWMNRAT